MTRKSTSHARTNTNIGDNLNLRTVFTRPGEATDLPKFSLADDMLLPETATRSSTTRRCSTATPA